MIERDDLRAAVSAGIVTEAQAVALLSLGQARRGTRENLDPGDEPFELFKGFNEIFIIVGLSILAFGWIGVISLWVASDPSNLKSIFLASSISGGLLLWILSEYFIRRRRMVAPAIALSILFGANAAYGFAGAFAEVFMVAKGDNSSLPLPLSLATLSLAIYWMRFKVPFALALIALGSFALAILVAGLSSGTPQSTGELFLLSAGGPFAWITLVLGAAVFIAAMAFDMSDPHRVTRRAANGFWLHVIAAPALVNTIALTLLEADALWTNLLLGVVLLLFAVVAIVIDRRSFLIAAIGYTVILTGALFDTNGAALVVVSLGIFLLFLGARWEMIRAELVQLLPSRFPIDRLPPSFVKRPDS
ncbi:MAG: hypothetical protein AAF636_00450 [Pseudomonadota bacterium]